MQRLITLLENLKIEENGADVQVKEDGADVQIEEDGISRYV
jgi:hypothetical protein